MSRTARFLFVCLLTQLLSSCGGKAQMAPVSFDSPPVASVLTENHFKSDQSGNLSENQLREILDSQVFLEDDTRLGIVPVATAYEVSDDLPLTTVPSALSAALEKTGHFDVTTEISTDWPKATSVAGLRELAARYRVKYLLLYRHRFEYHARVNGWGWTWPTVVGILATPATTFELAGVMEATMFDPRTGTILFTAFERVYGKEHQTIWNPEVKSRQMKQKLLDEATEKLSANVVSKIGRLVAARPDGEKPDREKSMARAN